MRRCKAILLLFAACLLLANVPALADDMDNALSMGDACLAQGNPSKALPYYELALNQHSADIDDYAHVIRNYLSYGDHAVALQFAQRATDRFPVSQEAYYLMCNVRLAMNNAHEAWIALQYAQLCGDEALPAELTARTADALYGLGDYEQAAEAFSLAGAVSCTEPYARSYRNTLMRVGGQDAVVEASLVIPGMRDEALRTAFETGMSLRLEKEEVPDYANCPLFVPTSYLQENPEAAAEIRVLDYSEDGKRARIGLLRDTGLQAHLNVMDISPGGMRVLADDYLYTVLLYQDGEITLVRASYLRGVEDVNRTFAWCDKSGEFGESCAKGLVWSPDGRWAVLTGRLEKLHQGRFVNDLFLLDTYTGEIFLVSTSPGKGSRHSDGDPATMVLDASFNSTGDRLLYTEFVYKEELAWSLSECDMSTLQTRILQSNPLSSLCTAVQNGVDESLICLTTPFLSNSTASILVYSKDSGELALSERYNIPLPDAHYQLHLLTSPKSGYGVLLCARDKAKLHRTGLSDQNLLIAFDAANAYRGIDEAIILPERQGTADRWKLPAQAGAGADAFDALKQHHTVRACTLSADGQYALLLYETLDSSLQYGLLELETMALRAVDAPNEILCDDVLVHREDNRDFRRSIHWFETGEIIVNTADGTGVYRLRFE